MGRLVLDEQHTGLDCRSGTTALGAQEVEDAVAQLVVRDCADTELRRVSEEGRR